jgi:hypothetical protein
MHVRRRPSRSSPNWSLSRALVRPGYRGAGLCAGDRRPATLSLRRGGRFGYSSTTCTSTTGSDSLFALAAIGADLVEGRRQEASLVGVGQPLTAWRAARLPSSWFRFRRCVRRAGASGAPTTGRCWRRSCTWSRPPEIVRHPRPDHVLNEDRHSIRITQPVAAAPSGRFP